MSVGEVMSMYRDGEIDIHPEFQRFFRWTITQKSKLIESLLLGIPIPSLFVSQREDGVWDVIDGVQRLSTIFEFAGILRGEQGKVKKPSELVATQYLRSLAGKYWDNNDKPDDSFTPAQRMFIKRAKLDFKIIKRESSSEAKYEIFQRINTLGTSLSDQEIRNCLLVMANREFFMWLRNLSKTPSFRMVVPLNERNLQEQYDMEVVLRLLTYSTLQTAQLKKLGEVGEFITEKTLEIASDKKYNRTKTESAFTRTFDLLEFALGDNTFRKYDSKTNSFRGPFLISAFEAVGVGLFENIDLYTEADVDIVRNKITSIWKTSTFTKNSGMGVRASSRVPHLIPLGRRLFSKK